MKKLVQRALFPVILLTVAFARPAFAEAGPRCDQGEFCAWTKENYAGTAKRHTLETANPNECVPLDGLVAHSLANRLTRDVTVYQSETCSTEAEFTTYPKGGTYVPTAPFVVRAIQIW
ncbi:peptidase inhibitor family I36 protein [Actinocrispum sp. NPDC049592]|uniref:peptidase inhibitor family I36 protein n=1 Tax=Actinocrispum sp. NPDC049592 TaxID=3154835 RepID=UPI0034143698